MISVNTNVASLVARRALAFNQRQVNLAMERLSTGLRINRASDDPAGLIASENLRREKAGVEAAISNASRAGSVMATAEGAMGEVSALLNQLQGLVTQSANAGGLSTEERAANQLQADAILKTIDRISGSTSFAGMKLLDGSRDYDTSGVNGAEVQGLRLNAVQGTGAPTNVVVNVLASARTALLTYTGGTTAGATVLELSGSRGTATLALSSGTTVSQIATALNALREATGLSATVSAGDLAIRSTGYGSRAFASVRAISGSFTGATGRTVGRDATVTVNGAAATADGRDVSVRTGTLDLNLSLGGALNRSGASSAFTVTGGGSRFLLGGEVSASNFASVGIPSLSTGALGSEMAGALAELASGGAAALNGGSLTRAQDILSAAIKQVATTRGRIGAFMKYEVDATVNALQVRLENLTDAESRIRDADFAEETSRLTRYQILSQVATTMLAQANTQPQLALQLLQGIGR